MSRRRTIGAGGLLALLAAGSFALLRTPEPDAGAPDSERMRRALATLDTSRDASRAPLSGADERSAVSGVDGSRPATATPDSSGTARVVVDEEKGEVVILHGPVDLPATGMPDPGMSPVHDAHGPHAAVFPTVSTVEIPVEGHFYGFYADVTDTEGRTLPDSLLHHVNVIDPDRRELFAPISQRVAAAGRETGYKGVPPLLFGSPLRKGQRLVIHTMLHNGTAEPYEDVVVRFHFRFRPEEAAGPLVSAYPFWVDVRFPAGDKTFDLPPGPSSRSYEATPAVEGRLLALSGHTHDHATSLRFENVTTGEVLWETSPVLDDDGRVEAIPSGRLYLRGGEVVTPEHTYRLTVEYDNPTGRTIPDGGMGSIGGIVVPVGGEAWPAVDTTSELYRLDRLHYLRELHGTLEELRAAEAVNAVDSGDAADAAAAADADAARDAGASGAAAGE